jgi:metallophosphoesterase (TIGR00282 family)
MKILILGDVSRASSCHYLKENLRKFIRENGVEFTIVNGENSAENNGISRLSAGMLFDAGADVITTGNHAFKNYESKSLFEDNENILRPANYPGNVPGDGVLLTDVGGMTALIINLLGVITMEPLENPFYAAQRILKRYEGKYDISILDLHAEATGEKLALGYAYDGKITVVFGTHTHVQTADGRILPHGTGYISDIGMCGESGGVLGMEPESVIYKMRSKMPGKFKPAEGPVVADGVIFTVDPTRGVATAVTPVTL